MELSFFAIPVLDGKWEFSLVAKERNGCTLDSRCDGTELSETTLFGVRYNLPRIYSYLHRHLQPIMADLNRHVQKHILVEDQ